MSYIPTTWVDGVTPVNAENMNKLEQAVKANDTAINGINTARANGEFKGDKGDKGDTGPTGPQGDKGDKGDTGPAGSNGKSAYEYAQDGGYTGTEEEFAEKLAEEAPKALHVLCVEGFFDKSLEEMGAAYTSGRTVFLTVSYVDMAYTTIMTFYAEEDGFRGALFNGWDSSSVKKQVIVLVSNDGNGDTLELIDSAEFATVDDLPAEPLIGTTAEITPTQVVEAIAAGRDIAIAHTGTYGRMLFTNFGQMDTFDAIASSAVLDYSGTQIVLGLFGQLSTNKWFMPNPVMLATKTDIPSTLPNPGALTFKPGTNLFFSETTPIAYSGEDGCTVYLPTKTSHLENDSGFVTSVPAALKNPYALTINGTSYDGSAEVSMTIGGGDSIPEYIKTEADRVAKVVQSRQNANTITFLACSDIHYYSPNNATANANAEKMHEAVVSMGQAMGLIRERCHIDFAVMFGDMTWDYGETHDEILAEMRFVNSCLHKGFAGIPQFRMEGNHDDAYESGGNLTASEVFANIGAWNTGAVYGSRASSYCYRDFDSVKLRVICLNSSEYSGSAAQYNAEQVTWLASALDLSEKGDDWRSIIVGHHPLDWGRNGGVDPTSTIKSAVGLIASFHGHIHNFLTGTVTNTELPRVGIPNAGYSRENQYGESYGINWKESTTYSKTPGTTTNTSFCVITIDLDAHKIYADHYGAGYDREITYVDNGPASYTNLVTTSIDPSSGAVYGEDYNGDGEPDGYKNGKYASGAGEGTDASCVLTGLIAYGNGSTTPIYIKGADVTTASHCRIICFNAAKEASFQSAAGTALTTYFTVETLGTKYYKLTPTSSLTSASGQTDYLRFSLIGTGENLVVTLNEPIE